jgi:hypothetical protein
MKIPIGEEIMLPIPTNVPVRPTPSSRNLVAVPGNPVTLNPVAGGVGIPIGDR